MSTSDALERLHTELQLIASSLLPTEHLFCVSTDSRNVPFDEVDTVQLPLDICITSEESKYHLSIALSASYPGKDAVHVQVKGKDQGRDEAEGWREWVGGIMRDAEWDESDLGTPLYTILTDHFLPLLAPTQATTSSPSPKDASRADLDTTTTKPDQADSTPHHVLIVTHHLISPTKRKDLLHLASSLNLVGFSKIGHPGILYAQGERDDLAEWLREVKSWNWLALRVRIAIEPVLDESASAGTGGENGDKGDKKQRGDWRELDKLGEAMEWLAIRGREDILIDAGVGSR